MRHHVPRLGTLTCPTHTPTDLGHELVCDGLEAEVVRQLRPVQEQLERDFAVSRILRAEGSDHFMDKLEQLFDVGGRFFALNNECVQKERNELCDNTKRRTQALSQVTQPKWRSSKPASQPTNQRAKQPTMSTHSQPASQPTIQSIQVVSQPAKQPTQVVSQPNQIVSQSTNQPTSQPKYTASQPSKQLGNQTSSVNPSSQPASQANN